MDALHIWTVRKCIQNAYYCIVLYCIVLYCIVFYIINIVQLLMKTTFKFMKYLISISTTIPFENNLFLIS